MKMKDHVFNFCREINKTFDISRSVMFGPVSLHQDHTAKLEYWGCYVGWVALNGDLKFGFVALSTQKPEALQDYTEMLKLLGPEWPNLRFWASHDDMARIQLSERWSNPQLVAFQQIIANRTEREALDLFTPAPVKKGLFAI